MRALFLTLSIALLVASCGSGSQKPATEVEKEKPAISPDSLRNLYLSFMEARTDSMPTHQVKEEGKLYPVDEAPLDTAFFVFREQLKQTVAKKEVFGLLDVTAKDIKVGFGAEQGFDDFVGMWGLASKQPDTLRIWPLLGRLLAEGGTFSDNRSVFVAPYYFSTWPSQYEPVDYGAIAGAGVRLREKPSLNSRILKTISHDIVTILDEAQEETIGGETYPWVRVEMLSGTQGYVFGKFVGEPMGYRVGFKKNEGGQWRMSFLLAGD
ncbi:MAG: SH3 domain-containing protein [Lewinellaceae bacterium]|nr:SH3 domain-containing protein [Phaeodactylibacter sp.]MCB9041781.1 SH3 domain-containing protein [Lewinellaceae bacterium]